MINVKLFSVISKFFKQFISLYLVLLYRVQKERIKQIRCYIQTKNCLYYLHNSDGLFFNSCYKNSDWFEYSLIAIFIQCDDLTN